MSKHLTSPSTTCDHTRKHASHTLPLFASGGWCSLHLCPESSRHRPRPICASSTVECESYHKRTRVPADRLNRPREGTTASRISPTPSLPSASCASGIPSPSCPSTGPLMMARRRGPASRAALRGFSTRSRSSSKHSSKAASAVLPDPSQRQRASRKIAWCLTCRCQRRPTTPRLPAL